LDPDNISTWQRARKRSLRGAKPPVVFAMSFFIKGYGDKITFKNVGHEGSMKAKRESRWED